MSPSVPVCLSVKFVLGSRQPLWPKITVWLYFATILNIVIVGWHCCNNYLESHFSNNDLGCSCHVWYHCCIYLWLLTSSHVIWRKVHIFMISVLQRVHLFILIYLSPYHSTLLVWAVHSVIKKTTTKCSNGWLFSNGVLTYRWLEYSRNFPCHYYSRIGLWMYSSGTPYSIHLPTLVMWTDLQLPFNTYFAFSFCISWTLLWVTRVSFAPVSV
jgi:hypothetical protein